MPSEQEQCLVEQELRKIFRGELTSIELLHLLRDRLEGRISRNTQTRLGEMIGITLNKLRQAGEIRIYDNLTGRELGETDAQA